MLGLYSRPQNRWAANAAMVTGSSLWGIHYVMQWDLFLPVIPLMQSISLPVSIGATICALLAYFACEPPWKITWSKTP